MHYDGVYGEEFIKEFFKKNKLKFKHTKKPFDFIVNGHNVEVKSAKLFVNNSNSKTRNTHGRYECWSQKQVDLINNSDVWVIFLIQQNRDYLIQGAIKGKYVEFDKNRKITIYKVQQNSKLKTPAQLVNYLRK